MFFVPTQEVSPASPSAARHPYTFFFGPFRFSSQLPLPELRGVTGSGRLPVTLTLGPTPTQLPAAAHYGALCQLTPAEYLLEIPKIARYHVARGSEIHVTLHPGAPAADVNSYLLGSVFGALCHQNHLLPLHASAIHTPAGVTAFLGESGAGKSTLAAALQRRGHALISDDICLLEESPPDYMHVIPVAGWLKLWRASLTHLGQSPDEHTRVFAQEDKYRLYVEPAAAPARLTLHHLVFLQRAASPDQPPSLAPLTIAETIAHMMRLTYLAYITELTGSHSRVFAQCALALRHATAYRLTIPWNLLCLDSTLDLLDSTLLRSSPLPTSPLLPAP